MTPINALAQAGSFDHLFTERPGRMPFSCTSIAGAPASFFDRGMRDRNAHGTLAMQRLQPLLAEAVFHAVSVCTERFGVERHRVDLDVSLQVEAPNNRFIWAVGVTIWGATGKPIVTRNAPGVSPADALTTLFTDMDAALPAS